MVYIIIHKVEQETKGNIIIERICNDIDHEASAADLIGRNRRNNSMQLYISIHTCNNSLSSQMCSENDYVISFV